VSATRADGLGEIVGRDRGVKLCRWTSPLEEHDTVPWEALPGQMVRADASEWRLAERPERLPLSYTQRATKPA
jgi:hypothetical protein